MTLTATDAGGSRLAAMQWRRAGEPVWADVSGTRFTVPAPATDGPVDIEYRAVDGAGNETTGGCSLLFDVTAPATADGYAGGDLWQSGDVHFTLQSGDVSSGVAATRWSMDGGAPQIGTDVTVTGDGEHTVTYFSTDNAGNAETPHDVAVRIDAGAPETGHDAPAGWVTVDTTVTLFPADVLSGMTEGLAGTTWELDGGVTQSGTSVLVATPSDHSGDGVRAITFRSTDALGNREAERSAIVRVDTRAPVTHDDIVAGPPVHTDPLTVTLAASDENGERVVSGIAATHYRIDDGEWQTGTSAEVTGDGEHTVSYYSVDNAGNAEAVKTSQTLIIATTPPGASGDDAPSGWVNHPVTVTLTPGERALRTTWELDGGASQTGTSVPVAAPADHSGDGVHLVTYRSWAFGDVAEPTRTAVVRVDTMAPQTSDDAPAGWSSGPVTVTLAASDAASGVAATAWSLDGGASLTGTSVPVSGDGEHTITYASTDNAGNAEPAHAVTVRIDGTAPQANCPEAGRWFKKRALTATIAVGDAGSGLASVEYRLDQGAWLHGTSVPIAGPGAHTLSYRAADVCGNVTAGQCVIGIDVKRPLKVKALPSRGKKRTRKLTLTFKITDPKPSCGRATVTRIVITTAKGRKVATIKRVKTLVKTNAKVKLLVKKKLKKGSYRFRVYVRDVAGNTSRNSLPARLTVR